MKKVLYIFTFLFLTCALPVQAQEVSLSISPSIQEIVTKPGKAFSLPFTLTNLGDPQLISVKVASLTPRSDGAVSMKSELDENISVNIEGEEITLNEPFFMKGKEKIRLNLQVQIPQIVQEKDYYLSLLIQSQAPPTNEGSITARAQLAIASDILISVTSDGALEIKPKVTAFYVPGENRGNIFGKKFTFVKSGNQVPLVLLIGNQGRHLVKAQGSIEVKGLGPKKNLQIQPQRVLAGSQASISSPSSVGGFFFGPYTISAAVNFGPSSPIIYANTTVFALPSWPILLAIFVLIAFFGTLLYRRLK